MNCLSFCLTAFLLLAPGYVGAKAQSSALLPAPIQTFPADQARMHAFPRLVVFQWSKVPDAVGYGIEIDYYGGRWNSESNKQTLMFFVKENTFTFNFLGDQPGSWRVCAFDRQHRPGQASGWWVFSFGPDNEVIPPPPANVSLRFAILTAPRPPEPTAQQPATAGGRAVNLFDPDSGERCGQYWQHAGPGFKQPVAIYSPAPEFTEAARKTKENGDVSLLVDIGADGLVKRACVLQASREDLGYESVKTVKTWRFEPARRNGEPVPVSLNIGTTFRVY